MKKVLMLVFVIYFSLFCLLATSIELERPDKTKPLTGSLNLSMSYDYDPERYYRFLFSDRFVDKDGNFDDLFASAGLKSIMLTKMVNGHLESDKTLYVYWQVDNTLPISRLTIEVSNPLEMKKSGDTLDLYVSCDNEIIIGGTNGYGPASAQVLYDRVLDIDKEELTEYVRLKMWTADIANKPAGNYEGTVVLRVYSDDEY